MRLLLMLILGFGLSACQTTSGPSASTPSGSGLYICNDFGSTINCRGGRYSLPSGRTVHAGIDFAASAGTPVYSATHGRVEINSKTDACAGDGVEITSTIMGTHKQLNMEVPLTIIYWHIKPNPELQVGQEVAPGHLLGHILPLLHSQCYGTTEHLHLQFEVNRDQVINPNLYWLEGPGKVTCWREGLRVPLGKAIAPLRCK